jgi:hypothetical protein
MTTTFKITDQLTVRPHRFHNQNGLGVFLSTHMALFIPNEKALNRLIEDLDDLAHVFQESA